jgi:hypothetical protein
MPSQSQRSRQRSAFSGQARERGQRIAGGHVSLWLAEDERLEYHEHA